MSMCRTLRPLAGMRLLDGYSVCLDVEHGGRVVFERKTNEEPSSS